MNQQDVVDEMQKAMKSAADYLESDDYGLAIEEAQLETWPLPLTDSYRKLWFKRRVKRHLFFILSTDSSKKFRVESYYLQQRFEHFRDMVKYLDNQFAEEKEENPDAFPVPPSEGDPAEKMGSKIDAGFAYDKTGRDITYTRENQPKITP